MKRFNKSFNRSAASTTDKQTTADRIADMDRELGEQFINDILQCKAVGKWNPGFKKFFPRNALTGEMFSGRNILSLGYACMRKGFKYPYFLTFNQAKDAGGYVMKGQKASFIYFFTMAPTKKEVKEGTKGAEWDANKNAWVIDDVYPCPKIYTEFNIEQCEGISSITIDKVKDLQPTGTNHELVKKIIEKSGAPVQYIAISVLNSPCYSHDVICGVDVAPRYEMITLPALETVTDWEMADSIALHELSHWTANHGIKRQLGSKKIEDKAIEELHAELAATFTAARLGIPYKYDQALLYVDSWAKAINKDPTILRKAAAMASRISNYLCSLLDTSDTIKNVSNLAKAAA